MIHLNIIPRLTSFQTLKDQTNSVEEWKQVVLAYDRIANTYYEKDDEEVKWIRDVRQLISETMPEQFKTGVHLLFSQASFMGEDIFVFEGHITTTIHASHKKCEKYQILNWNRLYCGFCKEDVTDNDLSYS